MKTFDLQWQNPGAGVHLATVNATGQPFKTLLDYTQTTPKYDEGKQAPTSEGWFHDIQVQKVGAKLLVRVPFHPEDKIYGLGLHYKTLDQKGKVLTLKTDHHDGVDNGRGHAPCPVFFSSAGFGVFFNTPEPLTVYVGTATQKGPKAEAMAKDRNTDKTWQGLPIADYIEVSLGVEQLEIVTFTGGHMKEAIARYHLYCGGGFLPPKWGLGFWYRFAALKTQDEITAELDEFVQHNIGVDVVGLEPGWQSKSYPCTFEWSRERFPDPGGLCRDLAAKGTRVNLWVNPYISPDAGIYRDMYPYAGSHTVWCGIVPDYTLEAAQKITMAQHMAEHVDIGASGYKIDECDGYDKWLWPDHAYFPSGTSGESMRQLLGVLMQKMTTTLYKEKNQRTYGLVRASNSNGVQYPYVIYNDRYDFEEYMLGLMNSGFSGVSWVPEIRRGEDASDWLRRFQLGLFSPMLMLNSWASGAKPWTNPDIAEELAHVIAFRKQLLPYLYNAYATYARTGVPPFRALSLDYPDLNPVEKISEAILDDTDNPYLLNQQKEIVDQLLVGEHLMAAFMRPGATERVIIFPEGKWYNFYTGELAGENSVLHYKADSHVPLFVRDGGMIPLLQADGTLLVKCFGEKGAITLYDDDGETYDYESGMYNEIEMTFDRSSGETVSTVAYVRETVKRGYSRIVVE